MQNNVSLCTIIKNSEDTIDMFLTWAVKNFPEVIVVVDPVNEDETYHKIEEWINHPQVKIYDSEFENFSSQWNLSFSFATKKYILYMGADEIMEEMIPNMLESFLVKSKSDILAFPRMNLQRDIFHYYNGTYPDLQFRFSEKENSKMDGKLVDETLFMEGKRVNIFPIHIIHFAHIRNKKWLTIKGGDRIKFAESDPCDGQYLKQYGKDWFNIRNEQFEKDLLEVPSGIVEQAKRYWKND